MEKENVVICGSLEEWIAAYESLKEPCYSPGWVAREMGVSRQAVNNWIHRDGVLRAFIYKGPEGDYVVVPKSDVERISHVKRPVMIEGEIYCAICKKPIPKNFIDRYVLDQVIERAGIKYIPNCLDCFTNMSFVDRTLKTLEGGEHERRKPSPHSGRNRVEDPKG